MNKALAALLSAALVATHAAALVADDAAGSWVQLIPAGTFTGRDGRGPFTTGDKASLETIAATTRKLAGSTEIVIDYDHQTVFGAVPGVGGTAKAAGWIKEIAVRDDGLFGRVEWTAAAAAAIRAGEYRYLSPVFLHTASGRVLVVRMAGLTNTPNLDLVAVAASTLLTSQPIMNGDSMDKILAALGLAKGTGEDGVIAAINAMLTSSTALARAAGLTDSAKPQEILMAVNAAFADRAALAKAAGLTPEAKTDAIVTAVQSAFSSATPDPTKYVPLAAVTTLQAEMKALQKTVGDDKAVEAVNTAMKDGKIAPALKDWALDLHRANPAAFAAYVDGAPKLTAPQLVLAKKAEAGAGSLSAADREICAAMNLDPVKYAKTLKSLEGNV